MSKSKLRTRLPSVAAAVLSCAALLAGPADAAPTSDDVDLGDADQVVIGRATREVDRAEGCHDGERDGAGAYILTARDLGILVDEVRTASRTIGDSALA